MTQAAPPRPPGPECLASRPGALATLVLFVAAAGGAVALLPARAVGATGASRRPAPTESQQVDFIDLVRRPDRGSRSRCRPTGPRCSSSSSPTSSARTAPPTHLADSRCSRGFRASSRAWSSTVTKHYPLEKECNPMSGDRHIAACEAAAALVMARHAGATRRSPTGSSKNQRHAEPGRRQGGSPHDRARDRLRGAVPAGARGSEDRRRPRPPARRPADADLLHQRRQGRRRAPAAAASRRRFATSWRRPASGK